MKEKINKLISRKFRPYPKSPEINEFREELQSDMFSIYDDSIAEGKSEKDAFNDAKSILINLKKAVKEIEESSSRKILKSKAINFVAFTAFYLIAVGALYLVLSFLVFQSFKITWLVPVGAGLIYFIIVSIVALRYIMMYSVERVKRYSLAIVSVAILPIIYVFPNLYAETIMHLETWEHSWISILIYFAIGVVLDLMIYGKRTPTLAKLIEVGATGLLISTIIFLSLGLFASLWNISWLIYIVYFAICAFVVYIYAKRKSKKLTEDSK